MFKNVRYSVSQLKKGMVVGKDIVLGEKVALSAGVELTDRLIESLEFLDVKEIVVKEKVELNQQVTLPPKPLVTTQQKFFEGYYQTVNMLQNIFENISRIFTFFNFSKFQFPFSCKFRAFQKFVFYGISCSTRNV